MRPATAHRSAGGRGERHTLSELTATHSIAVQCPARPALSVPQVVAASLDYLNGLSADEGNDSGLQWDLAVAYSKVASAQWTTGPSLGLPGEALDSYEKAARLARPLANRKELDRTKLESYVKMLTAAGVAARQIHNREAAARLGREAVERSQGLPAPRRRA